MLRNWPNYWNLTFNKYILYLQSQWPIKMRFRLLLLYNIPSWHVHRRTNVFTGQICSRVISTGNRLNYKNFTFRMYIVGMNDWCWMPTLAIFQLYRGVSVCKPYKIDVKSWYIYNTCALSKHIGNMCTRLRNGGKDEASPSLFPRFAPNTHIYLYTSTVHMYCIYPAILNRK